MKIVILQGTPRPRNTASEAYSDFFIKHVPAHESVVIPIAHRIREIERDRALYDSIISEIDAADGVLWIFPVYFGMVPGKMKRFIEIILERNDGRYFEGKHTALMCTSIRYNDHTALNYLNAVCDDLKMKLTDRFSAYAYPGMDDEYCRITALFCRRFFMNVENRVTAPQAFAPAVSHSHRYTPMENLASRTKDVSIRIALISDAPGKDTNLDRMIEVFVKRSPCAVDIIDLSSLDMSGCSGCAVCAIDNHCTHKDDFRRMYEEKVKTASAIVYAGEIKDRFLSARFKDFIDRTFYNNHIDVLRKKQIGAIISGNLRENPNITELLQSLIQMQHANILCFVTDEYADSARITSLLEGLSDEIIFGVNENYKRPETFLGVGGDKILRDFIYLARYPFGQVFKHYKKSAFSSFPQKRTKVVLRSMLFSLLSQMASNKQMFLKKYREKTYERLRESLGLSAP